ncbi:DnaJ family domain-containing protein [Amycolatopsis sp. NPDC101161]|uniref:DnaJ family domain-containing protein n=1 Tax=Amycolatopsis sp. NPDC101161 TaxID=3363940 RepID=UPI0037FF327A
MTRRKPPKVSFRWWVDRQIDEARDRGEFDDLPGTGKPLPKPTGNDAATDWVLRQVRAGGHDTKALLPPALALKREVQDLPGRLAAERTEQQVREVVDDLNLRIRQAYLNHHTGPPLTVALVDVEEAVADWRRSRAAS